MTNYNVQEVMNTITNLQNYEEELYNKLVENTKNIAIGSNQQLSSSEINTIVSQINDLSETRTNLYNIISQSLDSEAINHEDKSTNLKQQTFVLHVIENELNKSKKLLSSIETDAMNQLKMVEISSYYVDKYHTQKRLAQIIFICSLFLIIISYGIKYIDNSFISAILLLFFIIFMIIIIYFIYDYFVRTAYNFNEYDWWFAPATPHMSTNVNTNTSLQEASGNIFTCSNNKCCSSGTIWTSSGCAPN
jgi:hypothetical protein